MRVTRFQNQITAVFLVYICTVSYSFQVWFRQSSSIWRCWNGGRCHWFCWRYKGLSCPLIGVAVSFWIIHLASMYALIMSFSFRPNCFSKSCKNASIWSRSFNEKYRTTIVFAQEAIECRTIVLFFVREIGDKEGRAKQPSIHRFLRFFI